MEDELDVRRQKLLKKLYSITVNEMSKFYTYTDDWFDEKSGILDLNTDLTLTDINMNAWLLSPKQDVKWTLERKLEKYLPGYYGDLDDYDGELIDDTRTRVLYVGGNRDRGRYISFNVFISAQDKNIHHLTLLMRQFFLFDKHETSKFLIKEMKLPFDLEISIHPFKTEKSIRTGMLFSYYCDNGDLDKILDKLVGKEK